MPEKFPTTPDPLIDNSDKGNPIIERIKAESGDSEIIEKLITLKDTINVLILAY
ncbi:MAG: hypothetical protein KBD10_01650 [Candidatus Pacebacteria bacterium]|nr:hypothetical protein [Candidatus Paceibacterota bacterium]